MKIAVLGGLGMQGKAALLDLARSGRVREIICADVSLKEWDKLTAITDVSKIKPVQVDGSSKKALVALFKQGFDAVIDLLPLPFMANAFEAALETRVPLVSTNYGKPIQHLHEPAKAAGVALMPECGSRPRHRSRHLRACRETVRRAARAQLLLRRHPREEGLHQPPRLQDQLELRHGAALPEAPGGFHPEGAQVIESRPTQQHENDMIHTIQFPGLGDTGGHAQRRCRILHGSAGPGRPASGRPAAIPCAGPAGARSCTHQTPGLLSDEPVKGLDCAVTPHQFMVKLLEPQLQYQMTKKTWWPWSISFRALKTAAAKTDHVDTAHRARPEIRPLRHEPGRRLPGEHRRPDDRRRRNHSKRRSQPRVACSLCPVHGGFGPAGNRRHGRGGIEPQPTPKARRNGS